METQKESVMQTERNVYLSTTHEGYLPEIID